MANISTDRRTCALSHIREWRHFLIEVITRDPVFAYTSGPGLFVEAVVALTWSGPRSKAA